MEDETKTQEEKAEEQRADEEAKKKGLDTSGSKRTEEIEERKRLADIEKETLDLEAENKIRRQADGVAEAGKSQADKKEETPKEYNDRIEKEISEGKHDE